MVTNDAVNDPAILEALYWQEGLSISEIASRLNQPEVAVNRRMIQYGIDRRGINYDTRNGRRNFDTPVYFYMVNGYERIRHNYKGEKETVYVHQLVAIASGDDPHEVFSDSTVIHHENHLSWDNRPDNLTVMDKKDHNRYHAKDFGLADYGGERKYTNEELLTWVESFVDHFGFVPTSADIKGWPGPSDIVYSQRFGSWTEAIREAGYKPRSVVEE